jgi:membrane-associated phospholipid phosphatase
VIEVSKRAAGFYIPFLIFTVVGGLHLLLNYTDGLWVLWFCENFDESRYKMFSWLTLLGEPQVLLPIAFVFFMFRFGKGFFVFASWLVASLVTLALKGLIANHRPAYFFEDVFIACAGEIQLWYNLSTPSGHTTAAFAFFASLAITSRSSLIQFVCFAIALLAGLSRMVLFMHYFYDVYLGAIIGTVSAAFIWLLLNRYQRIGYVSWKNKTIRNFRQ